MGHSTGAQSALRAAVRVQDLRPLAGLVMAGPTVAPSQRSLPRLAAVAPAAYRRDSLRELVVVPDLLRANLALVTMLRSAVADRPEDHIGSLRSAVLLTSGRGDAFAPADWLSTLARSAVRAASVRTVQLPGSHNNPYTHPGPLAAVIEAVGREPV
jgi:pimeloyl-ACP methyl ester carboxylesterase